MLELLDLAVTGASTCGLAVLNYGQVEYEASGGLASGGAAQVSINPYVGSVSGGAVASGGATVLFLPEPDCDTCFAEASGAAEFSLEYLNGADGGKTATGSAPTLAIYADAEAGGQIEIGDTALIFPDYSPDCSGGLDSSGAADVTIEIPYTPVGGLEVSGSAGVLCNFVIADAFYGEAIVTGEALVRFIIDVSGFPVFIRRFDGDIRLKISEDGGVITVWGGQPDMDQGFETAVNMSLFTEQGWWGNALAAPGDEIGSSFTDALRQPLTNQARLDIIEAAKTSLKWLTASGIALSITVSATIPGIGEMALYIEIKEPEKAPHVFRYNINWQAQKIKMTEAAA